MIQVISDDVEHLNPAGIGLAQTRPRSFREAVVLVAALCVQFLCHLQTGAPPSVDNGLLSVL